MVAEIHPSKSFRVRSYASKDHAAVVEVYTAAIHQYPDNVEALQPHWQQLLHAGLNGDLADIDGAYFASGGHFWVATCQREREDADEQVVGIVALRADRDAGDAELRRMFVHPAYQRCGIGRLLVTALEQWAGDEGFARVRFSTANASRFYESIGYTFTKASVLPVGIEVRHYEKRLAGANN